MTAAELASFYQGTEPSDFGRSANTLAPPPLIGWRKHAIRKHYIQNPLIKRNRGAVEEYWLLFSDEFGEHKRHEISRTRRVAKQLEVDTRKTFEMHARTWQEEAAFLSSITDIALHPSYQRIVGMGPAAVPLIFQNLKNELNHWFWALNAITGENPVPEDDLGNLEAMRQHWLDWGRARGLSD
jgi:hypothetical protein